MFIIKVGLMHREGGCILKMEGPNDGKHVRNQNRETFLLAKLFFLQNRSIKNRKVT